MTESQKCNQPSRVATKSHKWGKGHSETTANRQHRKTIENMATAKTIEDLDDHEMTPESKLPKEAARIKDKRPRGPVNIQRANEQAGPKPHKSRSNEKHMKRHTNGKKTCQDARSKCKNNTDQESNVCK